jgi:hypothetical protein
MKLKKILKIVHLNNLFRKKLSPMALKGENKNKKWNVILKIQKMYV